MQMNENIFYGYIIKGDLLNAMDYLQRCDDTEALYTRYHALFAQEQYIQYNLPPKLDGILKVYQQYYREAFFLRMDRDAAVRELQARLNALLRLSKDTSTLDELEQKHLPGIFQRDGYFFLGGRTSGYYGPYVWKTVETVTYSVELPHGTQPYTIKLLDGFVTRSWLDYLSFGAVTPGGWADADGTINCIKASYDLSSEAFTVSLLKHEAQHTRDLAAYPNLPSATLEYRAKLVELIYSTQRNLLAQFAHEADPSDSTNGHGVAAHRLCQRYAAMLGHTDYASVPIPQIQSIARTIFDESNLTLRHEKLLTLTE